MDDVIFAASLGILAGLLVWWFETSRSMWEAQQRYESIKRRRSQDPGKSTNDKKENVVI
jgi:hypothetical protein